jgi:hypothetical protein
MLSRLLSRERADCKRAQEFLHSSRMVMNIATETARCVDEYVITRTELQQHLLPAVILNIRFLNKNLDSAMDSFSRWEQALAKQEPEHFGKVQCMLMNARKNFDIAAVHTDGINQWLQHNKVPAALYSGS